MSKDDTQHNVGKTLIGPKPRDAIHIAVYAAKARTDMSSGSPVALEENGKWAFNAGQWWDNDVQPIGIVDPFIKDEEYSYGQVKMGQWFYIWLIPNTITGLNHNWTHPSLPDHDYDEPTKDHTQAIADELLGGSETYLMGEASRAGLDLPELLNYAQGYVESGEFASDGGKWEGFSIGAEFWDHYGKFTGKDIPSGRDNFFTCSC